MTEPTFIDIELDSCHPHPRQAAVYGDASEAVLEKLRQSMEAEGQRDPIVVLPPDNAAGLAAHTVLDGHQRLDAARALGWSTLRAVVRHDLAEADEAEVDRAFLRLNFERRQLSPMHQAMILMELHESRKGRRRERFGDGDWRAVKREIAEHLGLCDRNAVRYVRALNTPEPVQRAVRDGRLNQLKLAERIETLPKATQAELAEALESIDDPQAAKALVASYLPVKPKPLKPDEAFENLSRSLAQAEQALSEEVTGVDPWPGWRAYLPQLEAGRAFLNRLVRHVRAIDPDADPIGDALRRIELDHGLA